jgi:hypothetical protein
MLEGVVNILNETAAQEQERGGIPPDQEIADLLQTKLAKKHTTLEARSQAGWRVVGIIFPPYAAFFYRWSLCSRTIKVVC